METIQVAIANAPYASALREMLMRNGSWDVQCVDVADPGREGVMVLDLEHLDRLPQPISCPERVVLIARNDPEEMARAWEAGVHSVLTDRDPLNTAVLAVLAARLRTGKASPSGTAPASGPGQAPSGRPPVAASASEGGIEKRIRHR